MRVLRRPMQKSEWYDGSVALHFADHRLCVRQFGAISKRWKTLNADCFSNLRTHCVLHVWACRE